MRHLWRHFGTGLRVVFAGMGVTFVTLAAMTGADSRQTSDKQQLMAFAEFRPLHAQKSVLVVDVRDGGSFSNGRIPGAIHVPVHDVDARIAAVKKAAKGRVVVTYCSCPTEASSLRAAQQLSTAGVAAKALVGGFPKWVESGGVIERDESSGAAGLQPGGTHRTSSAASASRNAR